jgi:hypothetical protein
MNKVLSVVSLLLIVGASHLALGQSNPYHTQWPNGVTESWFFSESISVADIEVAQQKWEEFAKLSNRDKNEWTGTYFTGSDTHGSYLRIAANDEFVLFNVNKCMATVMSLAYGRVKASPTLVNLAPTGQSGNAGHGHGTHTMSPTDYVPVLWDGLYSLVPRNNMKDFFDYTSGFGQYNQNYYPDEVVFFFSKADKRAAPVKATWIAPKVPREYEEMIKTPLEARITRVGKSYRQADPEDPEGPWDNKVTPVTLKLSRAAALPKMNLFVVNRDVLIEITEASGLLAKGVIMRPTRKLPCVKFDETDDCSDWPAPPIRIGWRALSSRYW